MSHKAVEREVAEAMLGSLQSATLSRPAEIVRRDLPRYTIEEIQGETKIDLIPFGLERQPLNRTTWQLIPVIHLAVQSMPEIISAGEFDQAFYDVMADFRTEVENHFLENDVLELTGQKRACLMEADPRIPAWDKKIRENGAFVSVTAFQWRVI